MTHTVLKSREHHMTASILRTPEQPSALLVCAVPARGPQGPTATTADFAFTSRSYDKLAGA